MSALVTMFLQLMGWKGGEKRNIVTVKKKEQWAYSFPLTFLNVLEPTWVFSSLRSQKLAVIVLILQSSSNLELNS